MDSDLKELWGRRLEGGVIFLFWFRFLSFVLPCYIFSTSSSKNIYNPGLKHHFCTRHDKIFVLNACCVLGTLGGGDGIAKKHRYNSCSQGVCTFRNAEISGRGSCHKRSVDGMDRVPGAWGRGQEGILGEVSFKVAIRKTRRRWPTGNLRKKHPRWTGQPAPEPP